MFDRLDRIGEHATTIQGNPRVIETPIGKAVEFDGVDDALFVEVHPLAGAKTFTWEAIFRPDGGSIEQQWFHLQEAGSENRMLFEIRVVGDSWFLDSYDQTTTGSATLMNKKSLHPLGTGITWPMSPTARSSAATSTASRTGRRRSSSRRRVSGDRQWASASIWSTTSRVRFTRRVSRDEH